MILPIGHQESSTRQLPWVTFALMATCLVSFLLTDTSALDAAPSQADQAEEAADYWRRHAYLEVDRRIKEHVAYDVMPNQRRQYLATLPDLSEHLRPHDAEGLAIQQAELDSLTDLALGLVKSEGEVHNPYQRWGYVPAEPRAEGLLTHVFMHAGWFHLAGNLFMLLLAGPPVEDRIGRAAFAGFFVLAGACSALFHAMLGQGADLPLVGASGAISGVLGAFMVRLWATKIRFAYFFMFGLRIFTGTFEAAAWVMLPLWFGNELFQAVLWDSIGLKGGVAYWAHVGGFLFGVAAAFGLRALRFEERFVDPAIEAKVTRFEAKPVLEEAMAARERGEIGEALELLQADYAREPDEDVGLALWDAALACAQPELGATALAVVTSAAVKRGDTEVALRHWSELSDHVPDVLLDPATLLRFVPMLREEGQGERAVLALRQAVAAENTPLTPGQAMRALEVARQLDPPSALRAARLALASAELHEAKRAKLEALVAELAAAGVAVAEPEAAAAGASKLELAASTREAAEPEAEWEDDRAIRIARFGGTKLKEVRPTGLAGGILRVELEGDKQAALRLDKVQAVSVAMVADQGPRPVLLVDLLANWDEPEAEALRGVRLRSDRFDPRKVLGVPGGEARAAFDALVEALLEATGAAALPSPDAARGRPFARFDSVAEYECEVLEVES